MTDHSLRPATDVESVALPYGLTAVLLRHDQVAARRPTPPADPKAAAAARRARSAQRSRSRSESFRRESI